MNAAPESGGTEGIGPGDAVFVTQFFPPLNVIGSQRSLRMAKVLLEMFEQVHVITLPDDNLPPQLIDRKLVREQSEHPRLRIRRVPPLLPGYGFVAKPRRSHQAIGAALTRIFCSSGADWMRPLSSALKQIRAERRVSLVVSTGSPYMPFLTVTRFAQSVGARCILDYRDLWTQNPRAPYPQLARRLVARTLEPRANHRADAITTVSNGCRLSLLATRPRGPVLTLMNTPDRDYCDWFAAQAKGTAPNALDGDRLNIVLTGTVYEECTCRVLLQAMAGLPSALRLKVRLHYFGGSSALVAAEFAAAGMSECLVDRGFVSKELAVDAVLRADALLSLIFDGDSAGRTPEVLGLMTTKVFDYFLSGKPIINVGPPDADVSLLAREMQYREFHTFEAADVNGLTQFLREASSDLERFRQRRSVANLPDFSAAFQRILADVLH